MAWSPLKAQQALLGRGEGKRRALPLPKRARWAGGFRARQPRFSQPLSLSRLWRGYRGEEQGSNWPLERAQAPQGKGRGSSELGEEAGVRGAGRQPANEFFRRGSAF